MRQVNFGIALRNDGVTNDLYVVASDAYDEGPAELLGYWDASQVREVAEKLFGYAEKLDAINANSATPEASSTEEKVEVSA